MAKALKEFSPEYEALFKAWPKIPRDRGDNVTITEKIDGTNACFIIQDGMFKGCQSRNRMIAVGQDNMGFAAWCDQRLEALEAMGDGYHYGEWAGPGIQKNPHMLEEKTFFLFNTFRPQETLPECIKQVPVLYQGEHSKDIINETMESLWASASSAGYIPEGIVVYRHDTRSHTKYTYANNKGKWCNTDV